MARPQASLLALAVVFLAGSAPVTSAQPVTVKEAEALANRVDAGMTKADLTPFVDAFDEREFDARLAKGLPLPPGFLESRPSKPGFAKNLLDGIRRLVAEGRASYRLVHVVNRDGEPRPLFRFTMPDGFNYHEYHLYRDKSGAVRIDDLFIYISAENLSDSIRESMSAYLAANGSVKLRKEAQEFIDSARRFSEMRKLLFDRKVDEAEAMFNALPDSVKATKNGALSDLGISQFKGAAAYAAAVERYRKRFPKSVELDLISYNAFVSQKNYDAATSAVDRLDKSVGGDPFLDTLRAEVLQKKGDSEAARKLLQKTIAALPDLPDAYDALIMLELEAKNYDDVASLLTASEKNAGMHWDNVESTRLFSGFAKSPAFAKWKSASTTKPTR